MANDKPEISAIVAAFVNTSDDEIIDTDFCSRLF